MNGATVVAYPQPNGGSVLLEVYAGDKRRGAIAMQSKSEDGFGISALDEMAVFLGVLCDAAIEAQKEANHA